MTEPGEVPTCRVRWRRARRIIRSVFPPVDLFEDIADPADWPLLIAAEQKTNPRLMETLGNIDLVPEARRVSGPGATYLMAPFTHVSADRPSRFTDGAYGVLYVGEVFETALHETMHHHARFMARTREPAGWTAQFRELVLDVALLAHDLRGGDPRYAALLHPDDYGASQQFARVLRATGGEGIVYPSVRHDGGECVGLFYPDLGANPVQGRHLDYHWNGRAVDLYRDVTSGAVYRVG